MIRIGPVDARPYLKGVEERIFGAKHDALKLGGLLGKQAVQNNFRRQEGPDGPWAKTRRGGTIFQDKQGRMMKGVTVGEPQGDVIFVGAGEATKAFNAAHNFGVRTRPHVIRPVRKKALFWAGARSPVKSVNHPGSVIPRRTFMYIRDIDMAKIREAMKALFLKRVKR